MDDQVLSPNRHRPLFAEDFGPVSVRPREQVETRGSRLREVSAATAEGVTEWTEGFRLATEEIRFSNRETSCNNGVALSRSLRATYEDLQRGAEKSVASMVHVLTDCVMVLFPTLCQKWGATEVRSAFNELTKCLRFEPSIVFHFNSRDLADLDIEIAAAEHDPAGGIQVFASDVVLPGEIRAVWDNGEAFGNPQALRMALLNILQGSVANS